MQGKLRETGISIIGRVPWASHFCQFYQTKQDLIDMLVPYFKAGLNSNEYCMWVTAEPLTADEAREAMAKAMPVFSEYLEKGQIEILPHTEWYLKGGSFNLQRVLNGWVAKLNQALARGYDGIRVTGNTAWLEKEDWKSFADCEAAINGVIGKHNMLVLCTYWLDKCNATEIVDVIRNHEFALIKQEGRWELFENSSYKATKQALIESENKYRDLVENLQEGIWVIDRDARTTFVNPRMAEMLGYSVDEMLGKPLFAFMSEQAATEANRYCECRKQGIKERHDFEFRRRDGKPVNTIIETSPLTDEQGNFAGATAGIIDITERKKAEESLRETRDYLENLFGYANAPIIVWDPQFRITRFNHAFERLTGLKAGEVIGKQLDILFPQDQREQSMAHIKRAVAGERWEIVEIPILHTNGTVRTVLWNSATLYDADGKTVVATIAQGQDITERKQAEEEIKRLNENLLRRAAELEAANRELEAFSYSVSHDLRAPLRSMEGFSGALIEDYGDRLDEQGKEYLKYIQESSQLMAQLIDDLLKLSRVTRDDMHWETVDLSRLSASVGDELKRQNPDRGISLDIAPDLVCSGDARLLRIMLENLLGNAWKFTSKVQEPRIELGVTEHNGMRAYFVRDNGVGFDMAYADKLFRPFQRLHKSTEFPGTGIGLATVQRIVRRHGGQVWAEGKIGNGAAFHFTLR